MGAALLRGVLPAQVQRVHQRQKLFADVLVGVVGNGVVDKAAAVQALLRVRRKAHAHRRAGAERQQGADARKQFAVNHRVQAQAAHASGSP